MIKTDQARDFALFLCNAVLLVIDTLWFQYIWYHFYAEAVYIPFWMKGNIAVVLVFTLVYAMFAQLYGGFDLKANTASELLYNHAIATVMSGMTLYVLIWLLIRYIPAIPPILMLMALLVLTAASWAKPANLIMRRIYPPARTVIIYDNKAAFRKGDAITKWADWKFRVIEKIRATEGYESVIKCIEDNKAEAVMLCGIHSSQRNDVLKYCISNGIYVYIRPNIGDYIVNSSKQLQMASLPVMLCQRASASAGYAFVKRLFDIIFSLALMIILSPILLIVAILIKSYDGGPALYTQQRMTKDGKCFKIYKFRSMRVNAEKDGVARLASEHDDRITPIGKFIRATRIDELPQMINILKGDMSVVGPRPERPEIAEQYEQTMPEFSLRLQVKAGLTGYAQIHGKYNTSPYDKLQMDLMYIAKQSIATDFRIILGTIKVIFMPESTEGIGEGEVTANEGSDDNW
ncbi:MAG: sugar transferase [Solobacterium sp.]|nr:sugar transferase [Solobacterium sp.]